MEVTERQEIAGVLDIRANRQARKWTRGELARRAAWEILRGPLFAWTPRPMWGWRRAILRAFGARIGREVHIHPSARFHAFGRQTTPELVGRVAYVSAEPRQNPNTASAHFVACAELANGEVDPRRGRWLVPGIPVEVQLQLTTANRTVMSYPAKPNMDQLGGSFRER